MRCHITVMDEALLDEAVNVASHELACNHTFDDAVTKGLNYYDQAF